MSTRTSEGTQAPQSGAAGRQVYDLSLPFNRNMPTYYFYRQVQDAPFFSIVSHPSITPVVDGYVTHVSFVTHTGTHVDAPRHFRPDGHTIDQIPPDRWLGEGPVIGVPKGPGEVVTAADIEASGMEVRPGDLVAFNTGWHHRYCGPATDPIAARTYMEEAPGLCEESARWLVEHGVKTVLVDTPALDACIHMPYGDSLARDAPGAVRREHPRGRGPRRRPRPGHGEALPHLVRARPLRGRRRVPAARARDAAAS